MSHSPDSPSLPELRRQLALVETEAARLRQRLQEQPGEANAAWFAGERRFRQLLEALPQVAVQGCGPDGTIHYWNRASEIIYGYAAAEAIGRNLVELIVPPQLRGPALAALARGAATGELPPPAELQLLRKDGSLVPVFSSHALVHLPSGDPELFNLDVALGPLRETEAALAATAAGSRELSDRFLAIIDAIDELINCDDLDTIYRRAVELARERLGIERMGLFLLDGKELRGTWGTDRQRQTSDEHALVLPANRFLNAVQIESRPGMPRWHLFLDEIIYNWNGYGNELLELRDWVVVTPLQTEKRFLGVVFNDCAISRRGVDPGRQDALEVYCSFLVNIIERKRTELDLTGQVELMQGLLAAIPNPVFYKDLNGRYLGCNEAFAGFHGLSPDEIRGRRVEDLEAENWSQLHNQVDSELAMTPGSMTYEARTRDVAGRKRITLISKATFRRGDGEVGGVVGVVTDITERKQVEEALRQSETQHRLLSERLRTIIAIADDLLSCPDVDSTCRQAVELTRDRLGVERCAIFLRRDNHWQGTWGTNLAGAIVDEHANTWETMPSAIDLSTPVDGTGPRWHLLPDDALLEWNGEQAVEIGRGWRAVVSIQSFDRVIGILALDAAISGTPLDPAQMEILQLLCSVLGNIVERKQIQMELEEERSLLRTLIDSLPDYIYTKDRESRFMLNNAAHLRLLNSETQEQVVGKRDFDFFPVEMAQHYFDDEQEVMQTGIPLLNREEVVLDPSGERRTVLSSKMPLKNSQDEVIGLIGITRDITSRIRLEDQLRQSEKMEAIGQLAGGIAHDFNNQLSAILGFADILKYELSAQPEQLDYVELILAASKRSSELTRQLLAFARKGKYHSDVISLHTVVHEVIRLLEHSIDKRICIRQHLDARPDTVVGDPAQLQNAFLNLAINARDALPNGGEMRFSTANVTLNQSICRTLSLTVTPGDYIRVDIADTGIGMDQATLKRIFEPFFTTKGPGRGTGMGLASVYGTVKNHKGSIEVHSRVGQGSTFRIYLPRALAESAPAPVMEAKPVRGNARIMVVDDELLVGKVAQKMLSGLGHQVQTFNDGNRAIAWFREHVNEVDLVILDMMMPALSGRETYLGLRALNPQVKAILSSGYALDRDAQEILKEGVMGFIQKPFMLAELSEIVAETLAAKLTPPPITD